ncbi:MAG: DoxX family membrane protein [Chloroflexia bacterium]
MMERYLRQLSDPRVTGLLWLLLRLGIGYQWLNAGLSKLTNPAWVGDQAPSALHQFLLKSLSKTSGPSPDVFGWYAAWVRAVALPNELWYSTLVTFGEGLVGLALVLGLLTRWAAFFGAAMNLNYIFAGAANANGYMLAAESAMLFAGAGLTTYALDRWAMPAIRRWFAERRRLPRSTSRPAGAN